MRVLRIFVLIFIAQAAAAQSAKVDSLFALLNSSQGKERVDVANEYAYTLASYNYQDARKNMQESFALAKKLGYKKGMAEALLYHGIIESNIGNDSIAQVLFRQCLGICDETGERQLKGRLLISMGAMNLDSDQLDSASYFYKQSYEILKDSANPLYLSYLYMNLGELYYMENNLKLELTYLKRSYEIRRNLGESHAFVWISVRLAAYYSESGEFKEALQYLNDAERVLGADTVGSEEYTIINKQRGIVEANLGNHKKALNLFTSAKNYYEKNPYSSDFVDLLIEIGYVQSDVSNYEISLKYYFQALKLINENNFERKRSKLYFRMAWVYYLMEQNQLSEEFTNKTLSSAVNRHHKAEEGAAYNLLGLLADRKSEFKKSINYYNKALAIRKENHYQMGMASTLLNLGIVYERSGDFKKAEQYDLQSLAIEEELSHAIGICYSYQTLGQLYGKLRDFQKSFSYLNKSEKLASEIQANNILVDIYKNKRDLFIEMSNLHEALNYSLKYEALKDSILGKNVANRVLTLQYDYELDQKDSRIKILGQQQQLQQAQLNQQMKAIRQQRMIIAVVVILLVIFGIIAYIIFNFYRKVKKLNHEVHEQNEEITAQSEELREANEVLGKLNREISEQKEEIQAQAEELVESNETISRVNDDLEERIKNRTAELREAYQELDTFFYRSSHDFRRPLTTFMGLSEVAKVTVKDPMALELFNKVNETAHNLDKMLVKLQSISVIGSQELIYSEVLVKEILQVELDEFRSEIQSRQVEVKLEVNLKRPFYSYPALIKIIVRNLIENAISFSAPPNPLLIIAISEKDDKIAFSFDDNGQGIDAIYQQRIFEMYFRANERSKGNGLGLYIVKKIVDKLKGAIQLNSQYGKGTKIIITLPNQYVPGT